MHKTTAQNERILIFSDALSYAKQPCSAIYRQMFAHQEIMSKM